MCKRTLLKSTLLSALTLGVLNPIAVAEPMRLDGAQMDAVTAGVLDGTDVATAFRLPLAVLAGYGVSAEALEALRGAVEGLVTGGGELPDGVLVVPMEILAVYVPPEVLATVQAAAEQQTQAVGVNSATAQASAPGSESVAVSREVVETVTVIR